MSSILNDIKHALGILPEDTAFDSDVILHTNTAISTLTQLGVGPVEGFAVRTAAEEWSQFADDPRLSAVQSFIFLTVKLMFDPPASGYATLAMERQLVSSFPRTEINVVVDYG